LENFPEVYHGHSIPVFMCGIVSDDQMVLLYGTAVLNNGITVLFARKNQKFKLLPQPYAALLYDKSSLFAGKLHALLCRNWRHREKGRDFYDYLWYLSEGIPVNIWHLEARMRQSGHWTETGPLQIRTVQELLLRRFENLDFQQVKRDVVPFIAHPASLDIWSREFFSAITLEKLKG